jgi:POT family
MNCLCCATSRRFEVVQLLLLLFLRCLQNLTGLVIKVDLHFSITLVKLIISFQQLLYIKAGKAQHQAACNISAMTDCKTIHTGVGVCEASCSSYCCFSCVSDVAPRPSSCLDYAKPLYGGSFHDSDVDEVKVLVRVAVVFITLVPYWVVYFQVGSL